MSSVIVLPGLDGTAKLLDAFCAAAPPGVECEVIPYPTDRTLGYAELERYVEERLPDRPLILIGESFSGPIAVRLAARLPARVRALVLCSSFVTPPRPPVLRLFARPALFRLPLPRRVLAFFMLAPFATPAMTAALSRAVRDVAPAVLAARLRELLTVDARDSLRQLQIPVIYLRGTQDRLVSRRVLGAIANAEVIEVDAPHALLQTAPVAAWAAIGRLI